MSSSTHFSLNKINLLYITALILECTDSECFDFIYMCNFLEVELCIELGSS
jgi:hypothetical protein